MSVIAAPAADVRVTLPRVVRSEWIKFRSLRSTVVTLLVAMVLVVGFGVLITALNGTGQGPGNGTADPTALSLAGATLAALATAVLGVLTAASEYSTGSIRATFSAVPTRLPVLWAKVAVFASVTFTAMLAAVFAAFLAGQAILAADGQPSTSLSDAGVLRAVIGAAVYLTGAGLIGLAVGALLRNPAGAISTVVGALFVLPMLTRLLPSDISDDISPYLPSNAGDAFMNVHTAAGELSPWPGLALFLGYVVVLLAGAAVLLKRRDA